MRFLPSPGGQGSSIFELTLNRVDPEPGGGGAGDDPPAFTWRGSLPDDLNTDPSLKDYKDNKDGLIGAVKSLVHAQKMVGADKIALPGEKSTPEEWGKFWQKLGAPEKDSDYLFKPPENAPKEYKYPAEIESEFRKIVHKHQIPKGKAEATWNELQTVLADRVGKAAQTAKLAHKERYDTFINSLGAAKDEKLKAAQTAAVALAGLDGASEMKKNGMLGEPVLLTLLMEAAKIMGPDKLDDVDLGAGPGAMTPAEAKARIASINTDPDLMNNKSPRQKILLNEKEQLYKYAYPEQAA